MSDTVKSIFRQREIEKLYQLQNTREGSYSIYHTRISTTMEVIGNNEKVISDKEIGRYDVAIPMLEVGDEFFLHDIQEVIVIKSKMRSSDGSITYYAKDKIVETENTKKSYDECQQTIAHWNYEKEKFEELVKKLRDCEEKFEEYREEYKYKNRFFNIKQS